ncbi:MAG: endonuclease [Acidimicrobiales bacterium]
MTEVHVYDEIIKYIFFAHYEQGQTEFEWDREEIVSAAAALGLPRPKNLGDVVYTYRHRHLLPPPVRATAPGKHWTIPVAGRSRYKFSLRDAAQIMPNALLAVTNIPDATPGIIKMYALSDEQAILARLRYNRLIDIFTGITCYSLQSHLRTTVMGIQVETDEVYVGVGKTGAHFVLPVEAKGGNDQMGTVQIEQDMALCAEKYPDLICRAIGAQFMADEVIALFEFEAAEIGISIVQERHYRLVPSDDLTPNELTIYQQQVAQAPRSGS